MLTPEERAKAVEFMATNTFNHMYNAQQSTIKLILINGHRGYAAWTDLELMRGLQAIAKQTSDFHINKFIADIAAEKFILE